MSSLLLYVFLALGVAAGFATLPLTDDDGPPIFANMAEMAATPAAAKAIATGGGPPEVAALAIIPPSARARNVFSKSAVSFFIASANEA